MKCTNQTERTQAAGGKQTFKGQGRITEQHHNTGEDIVPEVRWITKMYKRKDWHPPHQDNHQHFTITDLKPSQSRMQIASPPPALPHQQPVLHHP